MQRLHEESFTLLQHIRHILGEALRHLIHQTVELGKVW